MSKACFAVLAMMIVFMTGCQARKPATIAVPAAPGPVVVKEQAPAHSAAEPAKPEATSPDQPVSNVLAERLEMSDFTQAEKAQLFSFQQASGGAPIDWYNATTGNSGRIVSGPRYRINGRQCRDYRHALIIGGTPDTIQGLACQQADGQWQAVVF